MQSKINRYFQIPILLTIVNIFIGHQIFELDYLEVYKFTSAMTVNIHWDLNLVANQSVLLDFVWLFQTWISLRH